MPRNFHDWLEGYLQYTASSESPAPFHFWTGISTIAGALRRRVWIDERIFQWTPNFYIVLVGPPGVAAKSTTINLGMGLLARIKGIHFGSQSSTWQALADSFAASVETVRYWKPDKTEVRIPMSALTIAASELGTFLAPEDKKYMDVLVDLWDGRTVEWKHSTRTHGTVEIKNPWINMIGCTTPAWLQENFPEAMIGGGLTSRIVFVYGESKRRLVAYPSDEITTDTFNEIGNRLYQDLCEISTLAGEIVLTEEAKSWGREWYARHWASRPQHMASERFGPYIARKQGHIHKLAIVLSAARRSNRIIELEDLQKAEHLVTSLEPTLAKVFESIGVPTETAHIAELLAYVRTYRFLTTAELYKLCMPTMNRKDFYDAYRAALEGGLLLPARGTRGQAGVTPFGN